MIPNFKPMNPWGRPMPAPKRPIKEKPPSLYQVFVETTEGKEIPVGPRVTQEVAERFCEAIGVMIGRGKEKNWSNPRLVEFAAH